MINRFCIGNIAVYHVLLPEAPTRRERELSGVNMLLHEAFGHDVVLAHDDHGAPYLPEKRVSVSISHSRRRAVLAVAPEGQAIGVDIEEWRQQLARVAPRVMSPAETASYDTPELMLSAWTLKEAAYKAAGVPGLDFRADITLPCPPCGDRVRAAGKYFRILRCEPLEGEWLSVLSDC